MRTRYGSNWWSRVKLALLTILLENSRIFESSWILLWYLLNTSTPVESTWVDNSTSRPMPNNEDIQFWPRNKWIFVLSRQRQQETSKEHDWRVALSQFLFFRFCLFLLPYDYPLLTVKFSYFSDQDWDSRYWTDDCRDVPYQAQSLYTTPLALTISLAQITCLKTKKNHDIITIWDNPFCFD